MAPPPQASCFVENDGAVLHVGEAVEDALGFFERAVAIDLGDSVGEVGEQSRFLRHVSVRQRGHFFYGLLVIAGFYIIWMPVFCHPRQRGPFCPLLDQTSTTSFPNNLSRFCKIKSAESLTLLLFMDDLLLQIVGSLILFAHHRRREESNPIAVFVPTNDLPQCGEVASACDCSAERCTVPITYAHVCCSLPQNKLSSLHAPESRVVPCEVESAR